MTMTVDQDTKQLGEGIAAALQELTGESWKLDTTTPHRVESRGAHLVGPGQATLFIHPIWNAKDRVEISGTYPRNDVHTIPYGVKTVKVTASASRNPESIARDIVRKVLPDYYENLQKVTSSYSADEAARLAREELAERLGSKTPSYAQSGSSTTVYVSTDSASGTVRIGYAADTVHLDLHSVPADLAVKVLALLAGKVK